jgi:RHS repeat-associated protein
MPQSDCTYTANASANPRGRVRYEPGPVSDRKRAFDDHTNSLIDRYAADVWSYSDYYPFGSLMPGHHATLGGDGYRYGFNGKEGDNEVYGEGNMFDIGARTFDPRIGRWFQVDPKAREFASHSPYSGNGNNPILFIDPNGEQIFLPEKGVYDEAFLKALSRITGYELKLSETSRSVANTKTGNVTAHQIMVGTKLSSSTVPGFGEALANVLRYTKNAQIVLNLEDFDGNRTRAESYSKPPDTGLILDGKIFSDGFTDRFIAHLLLHEINETISLALNNWDNNGTDGFYPYSERDHKYAIKKDLGALSAVIPMARDFVIGFTHNNGGSTVLLTPTDLLGTDDGAEYTTSGNVMHRIIFRYTNRH